MLRDEEKKVLHHIARKTIETRVKGEQMPAWSPDSEVLRSQRGVFVTLKKRGMLRGCIGYVEAVKPLYLAVPEMASAAALRDPRFPPLAVEELRDLEIEISVLTPLVPLGDVGNLRIGDHGLYVVKGMNSGLLLPQVAVAYGWDGRTFLEETCRKAGLSPNAWTEKETKVFVFSADIF